MLSLHTTIETFERRSLEDRRLEQAIKANLLSAEQYSAIVKVFNLEQIEMENFWRYVVGESERIKRDGHISAPAISQAISEVLNIEQFSNLIASDIAWVK